MSENESGIGSIIGYILGIALTVGLLYLVVLWVGAILCWPIFLYFTLKMTFSTPDMKGYESIHYDWNHIPGAKFRHLGGLWLFFIVYTILTVASIIYIMPTLTDLYHSKFP